MKKFAAILLSLVLTLTVALADSIYVVSREDGSGTRAAFPKGYTQFHSLQFG